MYQRFNSWENELFHDSCRFDDVLEAQQEQIHNIRGKLEGEILESLGWRKLGKKEYQGKRQIVWGKGK